MDHHAAASTATTAAAAPSAPTTAPLAEPASPRSPIPPSPRKSSRGFKQNPNASADSSISPPVTPPPRRKRRSKTTESSRTAPDPRRQSSKGKQPVRPLQHPALEQHAAAQHAHNHSWNSTTRDSVVDNLLFSLDNLSRQDVGQVDGREDEERNRYLSSLANKFTMNRSSSRARGHTHSSSTSEFADSPQSKFSITSNKGRRSNSSSNFPHHSFAGKVRSGARALSAGLGRSSSEIQRHTHERSTDGGDWLTEPSRLALAGKSLSMDYIHAEGAEAPSVLGRGRPVPSVHSKYESNSDAEAAPEPFIAAGPRKMQNPTATGPVYVNAAPPKSSKPSTLRKITTQTDLRSSASALPSPIPPEIRNQAADFVRTSSMLGNAHPHDAPAPSPRIAPRREPSPPREKPGFFKRVFGGGSSRAVSTPVDRPRSDQVSSSDSKERSNAGNRSVSQQSAGEQPKPEAKQAATAPPTPSAQPTLNKKPSSFFRRRKKSVSESMPPPPLPINNNPSLKVKEAQPSPSISSLRKVMDPYLTQDEQGQKGLAVQGSAVASRPDTSDSRLEDSEDPDIFHSGYTPPPDASLGIRHPVSRDHSIRPDSSQDDYTTAKMKIKKRRPDPLNQDAGNDRSISPLQDRTNEQPLVSPMSATFLGVPSPQTPGDLSNSRPSTGEGIIASAENSPIPQSAMREFSAGTNVSLDMNDEGWLVTKTLPERPVSKKSERLFLQPTLSEERLNINSGHLSPIESHLMSPMFTSEPGNFDERDRLNSSASMNLPSLQVENGATRTFSEPTITMVPSDVIDDGAEYRERARKIFEGDEEDVSKMDAASWMGERNTLSTRTLQAYMQLFDFSGLNILGSLRILCSRLMLRGETQQFDRIITALSARWCECNPSHGFKAQDVVHTIIYSLILLNTDLHLADIGEKMSRSAYVKNTLPTIRRVVSDAAPDAFDDTLKPASSQLRPTLPWSSSSTSMPSTPAAAPAPDVPYERPESSLADFSSAKRLSIRPGMLRNDSDSAAPDSAGGQFNMLVNYPWTGTTRGWEMEVESVLKIFFNSIKTEPLPLHAELPTQTSNRNLSVVDLNSNLKRTGSIVSKAPSDNMSYRSKQDFRSMTMRWQSRNSRSRPKIYPASTVGSSRTSFDDGSGIWSPAESSKYSFSKTLTSASVNSFSNFSTMDQFKHSIGFANALSQAIIREETLSGHDSETFSVPGGLLEDDSLALEGAPWAKEGLVKHKHHMESQERKAKDRNWTECFAVLSKGKLTLFNFNTSSKTQSMGRKNAFGKAGKAASVTGATVGGGDWMENAEQLDVFILRQTIASTLPPPGYSKARPHVWALSLPSGAVHLFQVGTPEIAEEFMSTANYWSARLSKEPLAGGVSNIEYGWSDNLINAAIVERTSEFQHPPSSMSNHRSTSHGHSMSTDRGRRSSLQSSMRSSFDAGFGGAKAKLPGDKATLTDWQPPSQSMMASQLMEVDQLKQLTTYVQSQEEELEKHNELKHAIELAFSPRHPNHNKAMANWQRKSEYLLREIVKFRTYIDSLTSAQKAKEEVYAKKEASRPLSPVVKNDRDEESGGALNDLSTIGGVIGDVTPRGIYTSG